MDLDTVWLSDADDPRPRATVQVFAPLEVQRLRLAAATLSANGGDAALPKRIKLVFDEDEG